MVYPNLVFGRFKHDENDDFYYIRRNDNVGYSCNCVVYQLPKLSDWFKAIWFNCSEIILKNRDILFWVSVAALFVLIPLEIILLYCQRSNHSSDEHKKSSSYENLVEDSNANSEIGSVESKENPPLSAIVIKY